MKVLKLVGVQRLRGQILAIDSYVDGYWCEWMSTVCLHDGTLVFTYKIVSGKHKGKKIYHRLGMAEKYRRRLKW